MPTMLKGYELRAGTLRPLRWRAKTFDELTRRLPRGFYSTFTTVQRGTRVLGLRMHLQRLYGPAKSLKIKPAVPEHELRAQLAGLAQRNLRTDSRFRIIMARKTGKIFIGIQPFAAVPARLRERGVHVITSGLARHDPVLKDTAFITSSADARRRLSADIYEILLLREGRILEGMTSNFFAVKEGVLITASRGILAGVTRRAILRATRAKNISVKFRAPRLDEKFDEAFLSSSSRGLIPIVQIDGVAVGRGRVGRWTKMLSKAYESEVRSRSELISS